MSENKAIGLLGGTFNPPHIGHLRLAIEVAQALPQLIDHVELIPCANPPHKARRELLPFELRAAMLGDAAAPFPFLRINTLEAERGGPSYTWDTLCIYHDLQPERPLFFILGTESFSSLSTWHNGLRLPELANFLVVPRTTEAREVFCQSVGSQWPDAEPVAPLRPSGMSFRHPGGNGFHYLPLPRIDISASLIRQKWLAGGNINFLVPDVLLPVFSQEHNTLTHYWKVRKP